MDNLKDLSPSPDLDVPYMTHKVINSCYPLLNFSVF